MVNLPELSLDKLDDYTLTGLRLLVVMIVGSIITLPLDIAILLLQGGQMAFTGGFLSLLLTIGLGIISLIVRLAGAGYAAKWLYNWE